MNLNPGAYLKFVQGPMLSIQLHKSPLTLWTTQQNVRVKQKKRKIIIYEEISVNCFENITPSMHFTYLHF